MRLASLYLAVFALSFSAVTALSQTSVIPQTGSAVDDTQASLHVPALIANTDSTAPAASGVSSSLDALDPPAPAVDGQNGFQRGTEGRNKGRIPRDPNYGHIGASLSIGVNGLTGDVGLPINRFFNIRVGGSGFRYAADFYENDADAYVHGLAQFAYGKAGVDIYPLGGRLRVTPMLIFANYSQAVASLTFEGGKEFDLEDGSFVSSATDPVRGLGRVDYRHTSAGLTIGSSNLTRGYGRFTFPFEVGAIFAGTPTLQLNFTGTACNNGSCRSVDNDPEFQDQLKTARTEAQDDIQRYARFIPIVNFGVGYRF